MLPTMTKESLNVFLVERIIIRAVTPPWSVPVCLDDLAEHCRLGAMRSREVAVQDCCVMACAPAHSCCSVCSGSEAADGVRKGARVPCLGVKRHFAVHLFPVACKHGFQS
eukprot:4226334-Amphidinium_carterae.1